MGLRGIALGFACYAVCLWFAASPRADTGAVCEGTGILAVQNAPGDPPEPLSLELTGPERAGAPAAVATDSAAGFSAAAVQLGVAGCIDSTGTPGGTALRSGTWSLFGDAINATDLRVDLVPAAGDGSGWRLRVGVDGLVVGGDPATLAPGTQLAVGNWAMLEAQPTIEQRGPGGLRWWRAAIGLKLTTARAGFPAGATFLIGWAAADRAPAAAPAPAPAPPPVTTTTPPVTTTAAPAPAPTPKTAKVGPKPKPRAVARKTSRPVRKVAVHKRKRRSHHARPAPVGPQPLKATPPLGGATRAFPVVGDVSWGDSYGGARSDVSDGWHHGDDLFAPLGSPVVAVADGTVFSVGWNRIGGWRLWLIDRLGNEYYYAHLSGYTRLGKNNLHVRRGEVLGFVGNTGDAVTTEPHLHFEIHPSPLLYLGYDGAVDPTRYLTGWTRLASVKALAPVALPGRAPAGWGSTTDFRQLLALRPIKRKVQRPEPRAKKATPVEHATALPRLAKSSSATSRSGPAAAVAGLLLLAASMTALLYTRRDGRR